MHFIDGNIFILGVSGFRYHGSSNGRGIREAKVLDLLAWPHPITKEHWRGSIGPLEQSLTTWRGSTQTKSFSGAAALHAE